MKKMVSKIAKSGLCIFASALLLMSAACGEEQTTENVCEHDWVQGQTTAPTCTKNGTAEYTCSLCSKTKTEAIPALGHELPKTGVVTDEASCNHLGTMTYTCAVCSQPVTEPIPMTEHTYDTTEISTPPSCFGYGERKISCSVCGSFYTEQIEPTGHTDSNFDGTCDGCSNFIGEVNYDVGDAITYVAGPWVTPAGLSWWSYGLEKAPSEEPLVFTISDEQEHTEGKKSLKVDFSNSSKCAPDNPGGAYVLHLGMDHLVHKANYTLTFWAWASEDFTGTLNKMLNNNNFGSTTSMEALSYDSVYSAEELAGKGWTQVTVTFVANPDIVKQEDRCAFRIAFDVGLDGFQGTLYLTDFKVSLTDYLRVQQGLPPLNEPTKPVNTVPVLDEIPENAVPLPHTIGEGGVWTAGPVTFGQGVVSIDDTIEYAKGGRSILINTNKALNLEVESGFILPIPNLVDGKRYRLTFYAQGSETYNGALTRIFQNPNYTFVGDDGTETPTMLDVVVNADILYTAGAMTAKDWQAVTVTFTAHPRESLCSMRVQMTQKEGFTGQLWLSGFVIEDAPEEVKDTPQVTTPVLDAAPQGAVALPAEMEESAPWLAGPGYWGDAVITIDDTVEYYKGGKSILADFNKASTAEVAFFLAFNGLKEGQNYELTFYVQGSTNFNGALNNIFPNPNFTHKLDGGGQEPTMQDVVSDLNGVTTAGGLLEKGWVKVTISFKAHPLEEKCSLRFQFTKQNGWEGSLWLSGFVLAETEAPDPNPDPDPDPDPTRDTPQVTTPVLDAAPEGAVALPAEWKVTPLWEAGPGYFGEEVTSLDDTVEYYKGGKSIKVDFDGATVGTESGFFMAFPDLVEGKKYELIFYVQGSTNFNGAFDQIFAHPNFTHDGDIRTMLEVIGEFDGVCTAGGLSKDGWHRVSITFTAHPKSDLCALRFQFRKQAGWEGAAWVSGFTIGEAAEEAKDSPQISEPVLNEAPEHAVALPETMPENYPWLAGPGYFGDAVISIDDTVEYYKGGKSILADFNKASTSEVAFFLAFEGLTEGKTYKLTFYVQGSANFNGALNNIFPNPNFTHEGNVPTMQEVTCEFNGVTTAGGLLGKGWVKVTVTFKAHPLDGKCSLRFQFTKQEGWVGSLWLSGFVLEENSAEAPAALPAKKQEI